jgi:predicted RNA binding protein YcfA (HicA-like mRNA interferase family)
MQSQKLLEKAINRPQNLRFAEAVKLAGAFGFKLDRVRGSHHILKRADIHELLNF